MRNEITREKINEKAKQLVDREIYCNVDSLARYSIQKSLEDDTAPITYEDETAAYPDFTDYDRDDCLEFLAERITFDDEDYYYCSAEELQQECRENNQPEIFEYWAISSWLGDKLKENGGIVIDSYPTIWGRETRGQLISMDGIMQKIAKKLLKQYAAYD